MNSYIKSEDWEPVDGIYYQKNSTEYEIIKGSNNYLVTAGPGAGKTELLAQKASYLLQSNKCNYPKKILALSFKTDAKDNIEERVKERCGEDLAKRFVSKTYDSFFKGILDQFTYLLPDEYRPDNEYGILEIKNIDNYYEKVIKGWKYLKKYKKDFYRKQYLTQRKLPLTSSDETSELQNLWSLMLNGGEGLDPCITFSMITRLVQLLVEENSVIRDILELSYGHVFLDEFQDTTSVQYDAICTIFKGTKTIMTSVGDNKQRIMKWAGAKENIFEIFMEDFNATKKNLLINHRSAPNILKLQETVAEEMLKEKIRFNSNERWKDKTGSIDLYFFEDETEEADIISSKIKELYENGIKPNDICILVRQTPHRYCKNIIEKLNNCNIRARYEDEYQSLLREKLIILFIDIFNISLSRRQPLEHIKILNLLKKKSSIIDEEKIHLMYEYVNRKLLNVKDENDLYNITKYIINVIGIDFIKGEYPQYNKNDYIEKIINKFVNSMYQIYKENENWQVTLKYFKGEESIPIMSIHKSKGLEYNTIILVGIDEAIFWNYKNNKDEELCNFFVAISRAKERLFITSTKNRECFDNKTTTVQDLYNMINKCGVSNMHY